LDQLLAIAGVTAQIETNTGLLRPTEIPVAIGNAARARAGLDWAPKIPWDRTLTEILADWTTRVRTEA
jgi:GDP-4-dehydro-6-deoxy-D-mannose reductase